MGGLEHRAPARRATTRSAAAGYEHSLRNAWEIGDRWTACLNLAGLATVYEHLGQVDRAESLYRTAIRVGYRLHIPAYVTGMLVSLARCLLAQAAMRPVPCTMRHWPGWRRGEFKPVP